MPLDFPPAPASAPCNQPPQTPQKPAARPTVPNPTPPLLTAAPSNSTSTVSFHSAGKDWGRPTPPSLSPHPPPPRPTRPWVAPPNSCRHQRHGLLSGHVLLEARFKHSHGIEAAAAHGGVWQAIRGAVGEDLGVGAGRGERGRGTRGSEMPTLDRGCSTGRPPKAVQPACSIAPSTALLVLLPCTRCCIALGSAVCSLVAVLSTSPCLACTCCLPASSHREKVGSVEVHAAQHQCSADMALVPAGQMHTRVTSIRLTISLCHRSRQHSASREATNKVPCPVLRPSRLAHVQAMQKHCCFATRLPCHTMQRQLQPASCRRRCPLPRIPRTGTGAT